MDSLFLHSKDEKVHNNFTNQLRPNRDIHEEIINIYITPYRRWWNPRASSQNPTQPNHNGDLRTMQPINARKKQLIDENHAIDRLEMVGIGEEVNKNLLRKGYNPYPTKKG
jgi:hypothetical protein